MSSNPQVTGSNLQVKNSNIQVTSWYLRVTCSNLNLRVQKHDLENKKCDIQVKSECYDFKVLTSFILSWFWCLASELKLQTRQSRGPQDFTSSSTGLWKITVLPLYSYHILEASKLGSIDSN